MNHKDMKGHEGFHLSVLSSWDVVSFGVMAVKK